MRRNSFKNPCYSSKINFQRLIEAINVGFSAEIDSVGKNYNKFQFFNGTSISTTKT